VNARLIDMVYCLLTSVPLSVGWQGLPRAAGGTQQVALRLSMDEPPVSRPKRARIDHVDVRDAYT
jgi:hypothetical protein